MTISAARGFAGSTSRFRGERCGQGLILFPEDLYPEQAPACPAQAELVEGLPELRPPDGVQCQDRVWWSPSSDQAFQYGCASHLGPKWFEEPNKGNEDFAFAVERRTPQGEIWICVGVADGVSHSTWAERAAVQASAAFLQVVDELLHRYAALEVEFQNAGFREQIFAPQYCAALHERLFLDERAILTGRLLHPTWERRLYQKRFFDGQKAEANRRSWLQTTLLAAAIGPHGGFTLLLGDGVAYEVRLPPGGRAVRPLFGASPSAAPAGSPSALVTRWLSPAEVAHHTRCYMPEEYGEVVITLATDGVANTPNNGLEEVVLADLLGCHRYLEDLSNRPKGQVAPDNLSVAFIQREIWPAGGG